MIKNEDDETDVLYWKLSDEDVLERCKGIYTKFTKFEKVQENLKKNAKRNQDLDGAFSINTSRYK